MHARGDISNDMTKNGEMLIQSGVLAACQKDLDKDTRFVVFDVGANIGEWSAAMLGQLKGLAIEERVSLFAFEPVPATAATLRRNLSPDQPGLHIEEVAFSSASGTAVIYVAGSEANAGTNSLYDDPSSGQKKALTIKLTCVSEFCEARGIRHIHLLKCDTEGHDMEVIRGALRLLQEGRISVLQFEYNHRWAFSRNFLRDVFVAIEHLPYKVAKLQSDHVLVFEKWHPELDRFFEGNYALIHRDATSWFPSKSGRFDEFNTVAIK